MFEGLSFFEEWNQSFFLFIQSLPQEDHRIFWSLLGVGRDTESFFEAQALFDLFKETGLLHLLVLSGSQVSVLSKILRMMMRGLRYFSGFHPMMPYELERLIKRIVMFCYVGGTGFSAPLLRAAIVDEVQESRLSPGFTVLLSSFILHALFFSEQLWTSSFILSWTSFSMLVVLSPLGLGRITLQCVLSVFCQLLVMGLKELDPPTWNEWGKILLANCIFVSVFDWIVFPMVAILILMSLVIAVLGADSFGAAFIIDAFYAPMKIYAWIAELILCSVRTIRYI